MAARNMARAQSQHGDKRSVSGVSGLSFATSTVSRIPDLAPFQLMGLAQKMYDARGRLVESWRFGDSQSGRSLRDVLSSSQISKALQKVGVAVNVAEVKAVLRELGLQWNGPSASLQQFLVRLREYLNPQVKKTRLDELRGSQYEVSAFDPEKVFKKSVTAWKENAVQKAQDEASMLEKRFLTDNPLDFVKQLLKRTGASLYQLFREKATIDRIDAR